MDNDRGTLAIFLLKLLYKMSLRLSVFGEDQHSLFVAPGAFTGNVIDQTEQLIEFAVTRYSQPDQLAEDINLALDDLPIVLESFIYVVLAFVAFVVTILFVVLLDDRGELSLDATQPCLKRRSDCGGGARVQFLEGGEEEACGTALGRVI